MGEFIFGLYVITVGLTVSAITSLVYRIATATMKSGQGQIWRLAIMAVAGPSLILEATARRFFKKEMSPAAFCLATAGIAYWCLAIGLLTLELILYAGQAS